ncbi:hypothetical protein IFR04_011737 [Cadophora malorum]|uniref:Uncharacterized protein n=1 Tax=Cadophora malorum TaxID=108018 RepID=A0A8H7T9V1_9HELO|nr:hypothetical protein IFR04_011737 [Cadophora malorum]
MPFLRRVRAILHIGKTDPEKFNFNECGKWLDMGSEGYITEGFIGNFTCPSCRTKINAYRSVEQNAITTIDYLRFEQTIENGSGRCVMQVPITFEKEFVAMKKGLLSQKTLGTPCACEVVKEKFFASCKCVGCGTTMNFYNQVKKCKDVGKLRWFLARKDDKTIEEKLRFEEYALEK